MKKTSKVFVVLTAAVFSCAAMLWAADSAIFQPMTPNAASQAATSTNSTTGTIISLYDGQTPIRIWVSAVGGYATTNGELTVRFETASGISGLTNEFDTGASSDIAVTMTTMNSATNFAATNTVSDWFTTKGARYIRVGRVENSFKGAVSNLTIKMGYTKSVP